MLSINCSISNWPWLLYHMMHFSCHAALLSLAAQDKKNKHNIAGSSMAPRKKAWPLSILLINMGPLRRTGHPAICSIFYKGQRYFQLVLNFSPSLTSFVPSLSPLSLIRWLLWYWFWVLLNDELRSEDNLKLHKYKNQIWCTHKSTCIS